jgi:hypothetical protein
VHFGLSQIPELLQRSYSDLTVSVTALQCLCALTDAPVLYRDVVAFVIRVAIKQISNKTKISIALALGLILNCLMQFK